MKTDSFIDVPGGSAGCPARLPPDQPPLLLVVIDTEEEFDWRLPHSRENTSVSAIAAQGRAQEIFARHGIVPTYVVDYPVATTPAAVGILKSFSSRGACRIGAHLHPWVNPPHLEIVNATNSYPGNLPPALERAKLTALTEAIVQSFGTAPVVYKAGRYGLGPATAGILEELGYRVDVSV
ncbi:MAG TPA: glycosyltransferase, partial [Gammaproteobacteria bacterium]